MQIIFHGKQNSEETAESVLGILRLFQERYGINQFRQVKLTMDLLDKEGHDVELIDGNTAEVLGVFEVYQSQEASEPEPLPVNYGQSPAVMPCKQKGHLRLVVDNSCQKKNITNK